MLHDAHKTVYLTLEPITEYASDEYRTRIHPSIEDWDDARDVYCLVSEVLVSNDGTPVTQDEIDDIAEHLILDAFFGLVEDGIFEVKERQITWACDRQRRWQLTSELGVFYPIEFGTSHGAAEVKTQS